MNLASAGDVELAASTRRGLIGTQARRDPGAVALLAPGRPPLSFRALLAMIERIEHGLAEIGLVRGNRIAVALDGGPELAVAVLGVSDCCTCVPLNPALDEAACAHLLQAVRVDALLVSSGVDTIAARVARGLALPVIRVAFRDRDPAGMFELVTDRPRRRRAPEPVQPDDVALLMHTSGTTGRPKSVPITHRVLGASIVNQIDVLGFTRADRCLCVTPLFTNSGIRRNLLAPLVVGGSTVCTRGFQARSFVEWLEAFEPTYYAASPAVHLELLAEIERRDRPVRHKLRFVWSGATALSGAVQERLERVFGVPAIQAYGMCEAGQVACNPLPPSHRRPESVGIPVATEVAIRGDDGRTVPPGRTGEIWVRGAAVVATYENDPDANAQAFRDGWFKTGDLGYVDDDGYLFLVGRSKDLINRGGMKVSPTEVDAVLLQHAEVADAATFAVAHSTLGEDIVAAVVPCDTSTVSAQQLRDYLLERLAPFKVPSRIVLVPHIPRTVQGKMRRRELPSALQEYLRPSFVAASDTQEEMVAELFGEVLGTGPVGAHDNFFELGGDSLRAFQLLARVNARLGIEVDASVLFRRPTVAEFARELASARSTDTAPPPILRSVSR